MARATPQLRAAVDQQQARLAPADFAGLLASIHSAFGKFTARLLQFPAGVERGVALHRMMDRELGAVAQIPVSCRKGCAGCCHYEVEITSDEAAILGHRVREGHKIDQARLELQAARGRQSPAWRRFGHPENRCVFLAEDGACGVYDDRPAICRKHLVNTPAADCTRAGATVVPLQVLLAEILLSAELSLAGTEFGSLAKMVRQALPSDFPATVVEPVTVNLAASPGPVTRPEQPVRPAAEPQPA